MLQFISKLVFLQKHCNLQNIKLLVDHFYEIFISLFQVMYKKWNIYLRIAWYMKHKLSYQIYDQRQINFFTFIF